VNRIDKKTAIEIGKKIKGSRLLILDEVSMIGCKSLYNIHQRLQTALLAIYTSIDESNTNLNILNNIKTLPFGGLHVLMCGI
jgi:hypothetical protein